LWYTQELELAQHDMFLKDRDLEMLMRKAECASQLKEQVSFTSTTGVHCIKTEILVY